MVASDRHLKQLLVIGGFLAVVASCWVLSVTRSIAVPLALAMLIAVLVLPIERPVRQRVPCKLRWLGTCAAVMVAVAVAGIAVGAIWWSLETVAERVPQYADRIESLWQDAKRWLGEAGVEVSEDGEPSDSGFQVSAAVQSAAKWLATEALAVVIGATLVLFLLILLLAERDEWCAKHDYIDRRFGTDTNRTIDRIESQVRTYLLVRALIGGISAVLTGIWLFAIGVDFFYLWALITFLLNFIPTIGSIVSGIPPTLMALIQFGWGRAAVVAAGLLVIEQVMGNYIDPRVQGRRLSLSPLMILLSVLFWGWLWGPIGGFLSVPLTAAITIVCSEVRALQPVAVLFSRGANADAAARPGRNQERRRPEERAHVRG